MSAANLPRIAAFPVSPERRSLAWGLFLCINLVLGLWPGRALGQRVLGTDVSAYQPSIDWTTVKNAGVVFAWAKATEGTGWSSSYFVMQETNAVNVGIYIGAYHFARPSANSNLTGSFSANSEAWQFWKYASNYVKYGGTYCVPMLDWEDTRMTNQMTRDQATQWIVQWCNTVSNYARVTNGVIGLKPVIYTGAWYSKPSGTYCGLTNTASYAATNYPAWISYYPSGNSTVGYGTPYPLTDPLPSASRCYPWTACNIWQYGDTNWSGGDADVSAGNLSQFVQMFVIGDTNAPMITTSPTNITVAQGGSATFVVRATGASPLTHSWLFNGAVIPDATSSNYTIASAQLTNAGGYTAVVSNSYAKVSSSAVFLSVLAPMTNTAGCVVAPFGMQDWWPGDGNARDIYGGLYHGLPANGMTYVTGKQEMAFHFDGYTSYMTMSGAPSLGAPWTVCLWVNRQNAPTGGAAMMSDGTYELKLEQWNGTRQVGVTRFGTGGGDYIIGGGYTVPLNTWTHLAFVGTTTSTSLYVNGAFYGSTNVSILLPRGYIGAGWVTTSSKFVDYMLGSLDEIMTFNRALSQAEIQSIYNAGSAGLVRMPEITGCGPLSNQQFQLAYRGMTGKNFSIYRSPDLLTWTRLATNLGNPNGSTTWTDTGATNGVSFYRASQP